MELLGSPGGGDPVAQLEVEAGSAERDIAEHGHHVDDERFALRPVERLAPGLVDEREQVAGRLDGMRVAPGVGSRGRQSLEDAAQRRDGFGWPRQVAVRLLPGQGHERLAVGGDVERDAMRRREHRLDGWQALGRRRQALAGPQLSDGVHGLADAFDRAIGRVGDAHLLEAQREARAEGHDEPTGRHLVEGGAGHGQHDGMPGERVDRPERHPERVVDTGLPDPAGDGRDEADGVPLEVAVVDPDRVEALALRARRPIDDLVHLAASRQAEPDPSCQRCHRAAPSCSRAAWARRSDTNVVHEGSTNSGTRVVPLGRSRCGRARGRVVPPTGSWRRRSHLATALVRYLPARPRGQDHDEGTQAGGARRTGSGGAPRPDRPGRGWAAAGRSACRRRDRGRPVPLPASTESLVAPGVTWSSGTWTTADGAQAVQLVEVDPADPAISLETASPAAGVDARQTVRKQALRVSRDGHRVVAAINGDVWNTDTASGTRSPIGLQVRHGELLTAAAKARPTFGFGADEVARLGDVAVTGSVTPAGRRDDAGHRSHQQAASQRRPRPLHATLGPLHEHARERRRGRAHRCCAAAPRRRDLDGDRGQGRQGRRRRRPSPPARSCCPPRAPQAATIGALAVGSTVTVSTSVTAGWEDVVEAIGGREWLVEDGAVGIRPVSTITTNVHPRTAVGIRSDGRLLLATVDGRQPGYSIGMTAADLAAMLIAEGAVRRDHARRRWLDDRARPAPR